MYMYIVTLSKVTIPQLYKLKRNETRNYYRAYFARLIPLNMCLSKGGTF